MTRLRRWTHFAQFAAFVICGCSVRSAEVPVGVAARNVQTVHFTSASLNESRAFNLILPLDYENSPSRYPVLYLLHGYGDDNTGWSYMTNLSAYAARRELIVVMPDGSRSWYVNSAADPKAKFEDYIVKDLIGYVDSHYRTIPLRGARAIAGLSMGGYGAAFLGLKYYDKFAAVGIFSGAVGIAHSGIELPPNATPDARRRNDEMMAHFGAPGSEDRKARDPFEFAAKVPAAMMPMLYIAEGGQDFLIKQNHEFVALLAGLKIPYEYREVSPRVHAWNFWDEQIRVFLRKLDSLDGFGAGVRPPWPGGRAVRSRQGQ